MVPLCNPRDFLFPAQSRRTDNKLFFGLLGVVLLLHSSVIGATDPIQLKGEVGGEVAFRCPIKKQQFTFLYLQKGLSVVNGVFAKEKLKPELIWNNTWLDKDMIVHLHSVNVSHEGDYDCLVSYSKDTEPDKTVIHLSVTANFSQPEVTVLHNNSIQWVVTCSSYGGYPASKISWNASRMEMLKVNNSEETDPVTKTYNSSSTAVFNCSMGEVTYTCSMGDMTSPLSVACTPGEPPFNYSIVIAAAAVCAVLFIIAVACCCWLKFKKRARRPTQDVIQNQADGNAEKEQQIALVEGP
ncbi:uncharacterized protein LOC117825320 isoform X1 [Xyrichtys novacula]|uniref:Uncharacterized protein LOC117825320 isoform X1 n=1 Tax=Xyrichtys novacula TaxID=13765 RepID=A0AAV1FVN6_XYRNO|nr:uncharacterized protein LOC117825320 isoform X1 [Xyrichtys novacula]